MDSNAQSEKANPPMYAAASPMSSPAQQQPEAGVSHQQPQQQQFYAAAPPPAQPTAYNQQPQQQQLHNGQPREWSTGLCSCGDDFGEFCVSCWCPCIGYSKYKTRLESLQLSGTAIPPGEAPACGPPGVLYLAVHCLTGFGFIFDLMARTEIRTRYNIRGNALGDCCTAYCCIPCTQGQHSREIRLEEESVRARMHGGPLAAAAPGPGQAQAQMQPMQPMQYPPPNKAA